jgi:UDP-N-acetylmuramoyl-tripeptide--D-alanyl-D-alanine ligase
VRLGVSQLLVVGEPARPVHDGARSESAQGERSVLVPDNEAAVAWLRDRLRPGDVVLVKASRGARLDLVADALLAAGIEGGGR